MSKFKVRERVKVWNPDRTAFAIGFVVNQSNYRERGLEYAIDSPNFSDVVFASEGQLEKIEEEPTCK